MKTPISPTKPTTVLARKRGRPTNASPAAGAAPSASAHSVGTGEPVQLPTSLLRIRKVLERVPVSRSTWYAGIAEGRYPAPVSIGMRAKAWRSTDIDALIASAQ